ncbi:hypothetical protein [Pantoea sp.]|uniref:hypothetical protein n=1 Tax=Pantoea sp. TaxID=69393 RepID=UPI00289ADD18|nr:hypothetical protein [Pantoea sp.]
MATKIDVINRALIKLGSEPLMSETDDNAASRAIEVVYDGLLESLLRSYRWAFSIKRKELPALSGESAFGYEHRYQLPPDCIRIDAVEDTVMIDCRDNEFSGRAGRPTWQQEGRTLVSDFAPPVLLRYGSKDVDPSQWDASFTEAFACLLAAELCEKINQSSTKKQAAQQDFELAIRQARQVSAIERPRIIQKDTSWYTARL